MGSLHGIECAGSNCDRSRVDRQGQALASRRLAVALSTRLAGHAEIQPESLPPEQADIARRCGIDPVLESIADLPESQVGRIALVAECAGREQAVIDACRVVRRRAEVVLIGVPWSQTSDRSAFDVLREVFRRYVVLRSGWEWELPRQSGSFRPHSIWANFTTALNWLADGRLRLGELIREHNPTDAQDVYQSLLHHRAEGLFQVFRWTE